MEIEQNALKAHKWVVINPDLLGGQPTVKGTRLSVAHVLACLAEGITAQDITKDYPGFPVEALSDILASSTQIAEGVATAGVVVSLGRKYRVELPVLTAVAQVLNGHISAAEAVAEIMNLPQVEER